MGLQTRGSLPGPFVPDKFQKTADKGVWQTLKLDGIYEQRSGENSRDLVKHSSCAGLPLRR